ncbi:MAG TPA: ubiquinone/menaquinone biosynthesis methyltransferase [Candidatus Acidoferrales bacterium]|nr:ubiquinone/menaquinone biosynthesis methyltransferase [Candidatus Acidoferrales bacterium]
MKTSFPAPAPGTRPDGASTEGEASEQVRRMFSEIAPRYDLLNRLLSFSFDRHWRRRTAVAFDHILRLPHARVLDLCCGTGDLALALKRRATHSCSPGAAIFGSDFAHPMVVRAIQKTAAWRAGEASPAQAVAYFEADALHVPAPDATFDLITAAFGFRNLANYEAGLREFHRLLRPGGEVGILEFVEPAGALFGPLYRFYFRQILPWIGGIISGSGAAYSYLPASVSKFPRPEELAEMMRAAGFCDVAYTVWTGGIVALHTGKRPSYS